MTDAATTPPQRQRLLTGLSLVAVYIIWGSTYLAIKYGLEGFPPFLLNGIRLVIAGALLYPIARRTGRAHPTGREWAGAGFIGGLLFVGGLGLVTIAEHNGIGSGVAAAVIAVMPLWAALWSGLLGRWPNRLEWIGLAVGFVGVAILSREGDFQASTVGLVAIMVSPILWAFGSVVARRVPMPTGLMAAATQMLAGGALLSVIGLLSGESITQAPSTAAWVAMVYLIVFGSLIGYTAYFYLLTTVRPALATSYAYVNPIVAVLLGVTLGREAIGAWGIAGLPVILAGVALVGAAQRASRRAPAAA